MDNIITKYCIISPKEVNINGKVDYVNKDNENFGPYMKAIYKQNEIKYPKYFKMDSLCKLAFNASEIVIKGNDHLKELDPTKIGVILQNSHSSLDTDTKYNDTIKDKKNYFPSPAVFVYTLPNVMIGEICIRNKFQGENTCFIAKEFDTEFITDYVNELLDSEKLEACITGWVDYIDGEYCAMMFLVEKNKENIKDNISFKPEFINRLIK